MPSLSLKIVLDDGAVTRKVKFDSRMSVQDAHKLVKEKVIVPEKGKEYGLFLRSADSELSGVWLDEDRTLENYMLRDGDSLDYICRVRNLRVRLLDDTVKTLQVDEAKTVAELMMEICARIGIMNYDEYGLCHEEVPETDEAKEAKEKAKDQNTGVFTLRKQPPKERDVVLEQLSRKLNTDDNVDWLDQHRTLREQGVDSKDTLLLKRRLFYSDRNVDSRDPVQLNLLYVQTRDAILIGRHPVTEQQGNDCKERWINIRDVHRRILKKNLSHPVHPRRTYKYENELVFLKQFYKDVVFSMEEEEEGLSDDWQNTLNETPGVQEEDDDDSEPIPKKKPKTKKERAKKKKEPSFVEVNQTMPSFSEAQPSELDPTDSVDAFLLSIGSTLKTFSPYHLNVAKSKIFKVVQDHDLQQIVEKRVHGNFEGKVTTSDALFQE